MSMKLVIKAVCEAYTRTCDCVALNTYIMITVKERIDGYICLALQLFKDLQS